MTKMKMLLTLLTALFFPPKPQPRKRSSRWFDVCNDAAAPACDAVVVEIANAAPVDDDAEWFQVAPYGEHPNRAGLQIFTTAQAAAMVTSFNSLAAKVGRLFRGIPIYAGHPDVDPARWPDARRLGKLTALEAKTDGLYAKASWNALGVENNENGYYVYPSPRWLCEPGGKGMRPVELISVGLTNTPNIRASAPVTANDEAAGGPVPATPAAPDPALTAANDALVEATSDLAAARNDLSAVTVELSKLQAALVASQALVTAANDALATERELRRDALLDHAVESGRLTQAERLAQTALFNADFAAAAAGLRERAATYNTASLQLARDRAPLATAHERQVAMQEAVNAIMEGRGVDYTTAWGLAKKSPKTKHLFPVENA